MSETKWTPGPWHVEGEEPSWEICVEGGGLLADVYADGKENARLIAAAPELYEALIAMVSMKPHLWECDCAACNKARTAIAKARGES